MRKLTSTEVAAVRHFLRKYQQDEKTELKSALEKLMEDYPAEPIHLGMPIMASCPAGGTSHPHIRTTRRSDPWVCHVGLWEWADLTGPRVPLTSAESRALDYWQPHERSITREEIEEVARMRNKERSSSGEQVAVVTDVVRKMGFQVT